MGSRVVVWADVGGRGCARSIVSSWADACWGWGVRGGR